MSHHVLVIDDDQTIAQIIQLALQSGGYESEVAHSARDGMAKACSNPPALILLDYNMPGKDGLTLMNDMRSIPDLETVPIILVTALSLPDIVSQAVTSGAAGFLVKPFDLSTLLSHVDRVLKPKPAEDENEETK